MSEEEIFDGVIQNYIAEHTTTEKYYTQKYVDEIKEERDKYKSVLDKIKEKINKTNNLTLNETGYKEYLKANFIKDKDIFKTICHLEDFELIYGEILELLEEIK